MNLVLFAIFTIFYNQTFLLALFNMVEFENPIYIIFQCFSLLIAKLIIEHIPHILFNDRIVSTLPNLVVLSLYHVWFCLAIE